MLFAKKHLKMDSVDSWFYTNYVKNLRVYQYLLKERMRGLKKVEEPIQLTADRDFMKLHDCTTITEKQFKDYLENYQPKEFSP